MKILVTGSTEITDEKLISKYCVDAISKLQYMFDVRTTDVEVVSVHETRGVSWYVERWANKNNLKLTLFKTDWNDITTQPVWIGINTYGQYNKLAGKNRNINAVDYIKSDVVGCIVFDDGKDKNVKDVVRLVKKTSVPLWQINCKDKEDVKIKIWNAGEYDYGI